MTTSSRNNSSNQDNGAGGSSSSSSSSRQLGSSSSSSSTADSASTSAVTLNIKTLESTTHAVSIQLSKKVADLKQLLHETLEVPTNRQRLICRGQLMRDEKVLKDYALEDGHTLHLVTRPEDAPPPNARSDEQRSGIPSVFGSSTNPFRFTPGEYQVSIIGVDGDGDPQSYQHIVQAFADSIGMGAEAGAPTVIRLDGDFGSRSPFPGFPAEYLLSSIPSMTSRSRDSNNNNNTASASGNNGPAGRRSSFLTRRPVPRGHSLPHLPTIEAELNRAATQLRNVRAILAQPENEDDDIELEPLDIPHLESAGDDVDGDVVNVTTLSNFLRQLSEANRSMAIHLHRLSTRYQRERTVDLDQNSLQQASFRTARAMYRLASVQNTVFPMLANASFEGSGSGSTIYRYLPSRSWPRPGGPGGLETGAAGARNTIPVGGGGGGLGGRSASNAARPGSLPSPFSSGRATILPFSAVMSPAVASVPFGSASTGLIPSLLAHARATARSVQSQTAGSSTTNSSTRSNSGPAPLGMLARGPDGNLSYTTQSPPTSSVGDAALSELARTGFMDFWRQYGEQSSGGSGGVPTGTSNSSNSSSANSNSTPAAAAATAAAAGATATATARAAESATRTAEAATRTAEAAFAAVRRASVALDTAIANSLQNRRRERPDDFPIEDARPATRRRLSDENDQQHQQQSTLLEWEAALQRGWDALATLSGAIGTNQGSASPSAAASRSSAHPTSAAATTTSPRQTSPTPQNVQVSRSSSNDSRRIPLANQGGANSPTGASPGPPSPPTVSTPTAQGGPSSSSSSSSTQPSSPGSPAYNLGRIGVFISALLRMVDQPREDGSPRTLADVVCNDADNRSTILQDLITTMSESMTIRETRQVVEGYPAALRNLHPVFNTFVRERALGGRQLTEENMDSVAMMLANGILNAVDFEEILETLHPRATIEISAGRIRQMSAEVLREHFRRLIYLVVAVPLGREGSCTTFARDLILWIRDVVGAWRVAFYGLYPEERDHSEAQRIATHVVGSAIHANGRRWVELSNRATNTLVNVLCSNIVPRRRGEEQTGGLVGGAWPLMATTSRNRPRSSVGGPSLLGSTAPPYASPLSALQTHSSSSSSSGGVGSSSTASSSSSSSVNGSSAQSSSSAPSASSSSSSSSLVANLEWTQPLPNETPAETQERIMRRVKQAFMAGESLPGEWTTPEVFQAFVTGDVQRAIQMALAATPDATQQGSSSSSSASSSSGRAATSTTNRNGRSSQAEQQARGSRSSSQKKPDHRTRVEDVSDEEMS